MKLIIITDSYDSTIPVPMMFVIWAALIAVHVALAVVATKLIKKKQDAAALRRAFLTAWLIPIIGPSWVLWKLRTTQPPLLR
jgi:hypothetical protein